MLGMILYHFEVITLLLGFGCVNIWYKNIKNKTQCLWNQTDKEKFSL